MIWLILLLSLFLRLVSINQSLWWDEAINIVYARSSDFWWFVTKYPIGDFHPPGWFAILWAWGHVFGFSEIASRLPSVFLGAATVYLTYLLGKKLFNKKVGFLASLFLAIAPLHIYYSQEARMYAFAVFSVTLSFYFLIGVIEKKRWAELGYLVSLIAILSSDYLAYFVIPAQIIYLLWVKRLNKVSLSSLLVSIVIFLPWLTIFPTQFKTGMKFALELPGWANVVGTSFKDLFLLPVRILYGRIVLLNRTIYFGTTVFLGVIYASIFIYGFKKIDQSMRLLISWVFIPLVLAFLVSFIIPIFSYFRMIFILPAVYLILGKSISSLPRKFFIPSFIFICLISFASLTLYYTNPKFQREDWRGAINFVSQKIDNNTLVLFENREIPAPAKYYSHNLTNFMPGLSENLTNELVKSEKVFLFEYLVDIYDPEKVVEQKLKGLKFTEKEIYNFPGVGLIKLYVR